MPVKRFDFHRNPHETINEHRTWISVQFSCGAHIFTITINDDGEEEEEMESSHNQCVES